MSKLMPRKRTILGSVLAIGLIAGVWLSDKLPRFGSGFGLGTGGDSILGKPDLQEIAANSNGHKSPSETKPEARPTLPAKKENIPADDVLTILVEDRHYAVWRKTRHGNGYFPTELDKIIEVAQTSKPNGDGVRVRIVRSESARVTAWQHLQAELVKVNIPAESIVLTKDF